MTRALVVGAGLAGLACAFDLARRGVDVRVIEAGGRAGGVVGTLARDSFLFESGPHSVPSGSECFRRLCAELGLAERLIASPTRDEPRWLLHQGELVRAPTSVHALLTTPLLSVVSKLRVVSERWRRFTPPADGSEPDLEAFLVERVGREAALRLGGAFVRGVYAAQLRELGARSAFPQVYATALEHGGLLRAMGRLARTNGSDLMSFPGGMQELVDGLVRALGNRLMLNTGAERIDCRDGRWFVTTTRGANLEADALVLAVSAPSAHKLLSNVVRSLPELAHLARIDHGRIALAHIGFELREAPLPRGFGFLVPPDEPGAKVLGMIFSSNLFPGRAPRDHGSVAAFYPWNELAALGERERAERVARDLASVLHWPKAPAIRTSASWSWSDVIPRHAVGHAERMRALDLALERAAPRLLLAGAYTGGVSVEQVLARGRSCATARNAERNSA